MDSGEQKDRLIVCERMSVGVVAYSGAMIAALAFLGRETPLTENIVTGLFWLTGATVTSLCGGKAVQILAQIFYPVRKP